MRKLKNSELDRLTIQEFQSVPKSELIVILDNIRSLNNIGSVFRTCDAFLIKKIYLCGITAKPPHKDIHKTALGSTESVSWEYAKSTVETVFRLKSQQIKILAIEQAVNAIALNHYMPEPQTTYAVVFGNEVKGVSQEVVNLCDNVIEIPQFGTKHSLNIAVSAGVVIWDLYNKLVSVNSN